MKWYPSLKTINNGTCKQKYLYIYTVNKYSIYIIKNICLWHTDIRLPLNGSKAHLNNSQIKQSDIITLYNACVSACRQYSSVNTY